MMRTHALSLALASLSLVSLGCGSDTSEPAASASSAVDLAGLYQSLNELADRLGTGQPAPAEVDASRRELDAVLDAAGPEEEFPLRPNLERVVGILSESEGEVSAQQVSAVQAEIRTMLESLQLMGVGAPAPSPG